MPKDPKDRFSKWAKNGPLSPQQVLYAGLDAYASILIYYEILVQSPISFEKAPSSVNVGEKVVLLNSSGARVLATGTICKETLDNQYGGYNLKKRLVVLVDSVTCPNAKVPHAKMINTDKRTLKDQQGEKLVWNQSSVRVGSIVSRAQTPPLSDIQERLDSSISSSVETKEADPTEETQSPFQVLLDIFHAMQRITRTLKKRKSG